MKYAKKIINEVESNGKKVDPEVKKGLYAVEKMHDLIKKVKGSPSKVHEKVHNPTKRK